MKQINLFIFIALTCSHSIIGMEFRKAVNDDIQGIVDLINTQAYKDDDKIVIVPEKFRFEYVQSAAHEGKLFIALDGKEIIGYKKLFCITNKEECNDILSNELRCKNTNPIACTLVSLHDLASKDAAHQDITKVFSLPTTYVYNGADFTHPAYRGKSVNTNLTEYALNIVSKDVINHIQSQRSLYLAMAYGLTKDNAGKESNVLDGRTNSIIKTFIPFIKATTQTVDCPLPKVVLLSRHHAFKPSFDPHATECKPLSHKDSIPGYGCLIVCSLDQKID